MSIFSERVIKAALVIPRGRVTTYGRIARACGGGSMAARSIASILAKAYDLGETNIPFHRIVYANGKIWVDDVHRAKRMKLYRNEGITVDKKNRIVDFSNLVFDFS